MRKLIPWLIIIVAVALIWRACAPIPHAPGTLILKEPEQVIFSSTQPVIEKKGWTLKPLAIFTIEARVLGVMPCSGDPSDDLAPYDLALGWGRMSDTAVLERLDITQSNRFYHWRYWGEKPPIPEGEIITHSTNMHVIPDDDGVLKQISSLHLGSLVKLSGYLVEATHPKASKPWRSSLSRDDEGEGACELMLVRNVHEITTSPSPASLRDTSPTAPPR